MTAQEINNWIELAKYRKFFFNSEKKLLLCPASALAVCIRVGSDSLTAIGKRLCQCFYEESPSIKTRLNNYGKYTILKVTNAAVIRPTGASFVIFIHGLRVSQLERKYFDDGEEWLATQGWKSGPQSFESENANDNVQRTVSATILQLSSLLTNDFRRALLRQLVDACEAGHSIDASVQTDSAFIHSISVPSTSGPAEASGSLSENINQTETCNSQQYLVDRNLNDCAIRGQNRISATKRGNTATGLQHTSKQRKHAKYSHMYEVRSKPFEFGNSIQLRSSVLRSRNTSC